MSKALRSKEKRKLWWRMQPVVKFTLWESSVKELPSLINNLVIKLGNYTSFELTFSWVHILWNYTSIEFTFSLHGSLSGSLRGSLNFNGWALDGWTGAVSSTIGLFLIQLQDKGPLFRQVTWRYQVKVDKDKKDVLFWPSSQSIRMSAIEIQYNGLPTKIRELLSDNLSWIIFCKTPFFLPIVGFSFGNHFLKRLVLTWRCSHMTKLLAKHSSRFRKCRHIGRSQPSVPCIAHCLLQGQVTEKRWVNLFIQTARRSERAESKKLRTCSEKF